MKYIASPLSVVDIRVITEDKRPVVHVFESDSYMCLTGEVDQKPQNMVALSKKLRELVISKLN